MQSRRGGAGTSSAYAATVGWLVGRLAGWAAGWLGGWLVGRPNCQGGCRDRSSSRRSSSRKDSPGKGTTVTGGVPFQGRLRSCSRSDLSPGVYAGDGGERSSLSENAPSGAGLGHASASLGMFATWPLHVRHLELWRRSIVTTKDTKSTKMQFEDLAYRVIGCAIEVHRQRRHPTVRSVTSSCSSCASWSSRTIGDDCRRRPVGSAASSPDHASHQRSARRAIPG